MTLLILKTKKSKYKDKGSVRQHLGLIGLKNWCFIRRLLVENDLSTITMKTNAPVNNE